MAKFKLLVDHGPKAGEMWENGYDTDNLRRLEGLRSNRRGSIPATQAAIDRWGRAIVEWYNNTRVEGEKERRFIRAEFETEGAMPHNQKVGKSG